MAGLGNLHLHIFVFFFSQVKKVSEVLEEGNSLGMLEVVRDTRFCKDSCEEEELGRWCSLHRVFPSCPALCLRRYSAIQVAEGSYPCKEATSWKEELFVGWVETKGLSIFFPTAGNTREKIWELRGKPLSSPLSPGTRAGSPGSPRNSPTALLTNLFCFLGKPAADADWCPVAQDRGELCGGTSALGLHPLPSSFLFSKMC